MSLIQTKRIYYRDPHATAHITRWEPRGPNVIALHESVAFPEGGGQLPDVGIVRQDDRTARFTDTQKRFTTKVFPANFPAVQVGGEIHITLDSALVDAWDPTRPIEVIIDRVRRAKLTRSHTAAHLVYLGLLEADPSVKERVSGCYIDVDGGRFDIRVDEHFSAEQLEVIFQTAIRWSEADYPIEIEALAGEPDCRVWVSNGVRIPCGGCHLPTTGWAGAISIQRRSKGKNLDRFYYSLLDPLPDAVLELLLAVPNPAADPVTALT